MEVSELFIGAYVTIPDSRIGKAIFIDICGNVIVQLANGDSRPYLAKDLKPVIFTPDIFLSNGFEDIDDKDLKRMRYEREGIKVVWVYSFHGETDNSWQIYNAVFGTIHNTRRIQFVHELQRLLIDCGLSDLGLNFKVWASTEDNGQAARITALETE